MILLVAWLSGAESWKRLVDNVDQGTERGPLIQTQGNTFLRGFDATVLCEVGLVPLPDVHALVAGGHADVVSRFNVSAKVYVIVAFCRLYIFVDVG